MLLTATVSAVAFARSGVLSTAEVAALEQELLTPDPGVGMHRPMESARLRSMDAVTAYGAWLYALVRLFKPQCVIETGVQNGCSTELILWALHRNRKGQLVSIDSGPTSTDGSHASHHHATANGEPGRDIHPALKSCWQLIVGMTRDCLPAVAQRHAPIDLFWHDSDHSDNNVYFEFAAASPFVRRGGLLCMHDFHGQPTGLDEPEFKLVVPQMEPYLRVWQRMI